MRRVLVADDLSDLEEVKTQENKRHKRREREQEMHGFLDVARGGARRTLRQLSDAVKGALVASGVGFDPALACRRWRATGRPPRRPAAFPTVTPSPLARSEQPVRTVLVAQSSPVYLKPKEA